MFTPVSVIFCPPVPQWAPVTFNSSDNEFAATVYYYCDDGHAFEDELKKLEVAEKAKHTSEARTSFCNKEKNWIPDLGNCIRELWFEPHIRCNVRIMVYNYIVYRRLLGTL